MSTVPQPYERQANFTSFESSNPTTPKPGASLDAEFNELLLTVNALLGRLSEIQRDDGKLRNASVHPDALSLEVRALLAITGGQIEGAWVTGVSYDKGDVVSAQDATYIAAVGHIAVGHLHLLPR